LPRGPIGAENPFGPQILPRVKGVESPPGRFPKTQEGQPKRGPKEELKKIRGGKNQRTPWLEEKKGWKPLKALYPAL